MIDPKLIDGYYDDDWLEPKTSFTSITYEGVPLQADKYAPGNTVHGKLSVLDVATNSMLKKGVIKPILVDFKFSGWIPDDQSDAIIGTVWACPYVLSGFTDTAAEYKPYYFKAQACLDKQDMLAPPGLLYGMLADRVKDMHKFLVATINKLAVETEKKFPDLKGAAAIIQIPTNHYQPVYYVYTQHKDTYAKWQIQYSE